MAFPILLDPSISTAFEAECGFPLENHLVMACKVGSESHGTKVASSDALDDEDYFMVVLPPPKRVIGLLHWDCWVMQKEELDVVVYSLDKYVRLLLKCNPNVIGTLWLRDYLYVSEAFQDLLDNRDRLVSTKIVASFGGYAMAQFHSILGGQYKGYMGAKRKELLDYYGYDPKNVAHCIRLYRMAIEFLETGQMNVFRPDAQELVAIKQGDWGRGDQAMARIRKEAKDLDMRFAAAKNNCTLPSTPDLEFADRYLVNTTLTLWGK